MNHSILATAVASSIVVACSTGNHSERLIADNPVAVQTAVPILRSTDWITASGRIESQATAAISTRMMGFISRISVKPGDHVQKGQLLVTISSEDIQAKRAQAEAMIGEAEAALTDAQRDYERVEDLHKKQSASLKEFENARLRLVSVKAKTESAHQMKNETDAMLKYTSLMAPFTGVITQRNLDEGSMAAPGMPILILQKLSGFQVRAFIQEDEIDEATLGMKADITIKSTGKSYQGKVSEISPSSQYTGGQFQVKIDLTANQNVELFPGMHVNVSIPMSRTSARQRVMVPASAIVTRDQLTGLYIVGEGRTAQLRWVRPGRRFADEIEILSGLSAGERFIVKADGRLYSGVTLHFKTTEIVLK